MRKLYFNLSLLLLFSLAISACKKETTDTSPNATSAFTVVNGLVGNEFLFPNFNGTTLGVKYYNQLNRLSYGQYFVYNSYSSQLKLGLFQAPDTTATSKPVYNLTLNLPVNTSHTLFLMGTPQLPDSLFVTDNLPYHAPVDSTMGIRFVHMSKGNGAISINILGQPNGSEVQSLPYKGINTFKNYPAGSAVGSYIFEFRDKDTNALLGTYTMNDIGTATVESSVKRYRNFTLALLGAPSGSAPDRILPLAY